MGAPKRMRMPSGGSRKKIKSTRRPRASLFNVRRQPKNDDQVTVRRVTTQSQLTVTNSWQGRNVSVTLADFPNYSQFTSLFEVYRFNWLKIRFQPQFNTLGANEYLANVNATIPFVSVPRMYTIIDEDGGLDTSTEAKIQSYNTVKVVSKPMEEIVIFVRNPAAQAAFGTVTFLTGAAPEPRKWLDTDNFNIVHYGAGAGGIMPYASATGGTFVYTLIIEASISFKGVKPPT